MVFPLGLFHAMAVPRQCSKKGEAEAIRLLEAYILDLPQNHFINILLIKARSKASSGSVERGAAKKLWPDLIYYTCHTMASPLKSGSPHSNVLYSNPDHPSFCIDIHLFNTSNP